MRAGCSFTAYIAHSKLTNRVVLSYGRFVVYGMELHNVPHNATTFNCPVQHFALKLCTMPPASPSMPMRIKFHVSRLC